MKKLILYIFLFPLSLLAQGSDEAAFFSATGIDATQQGYVSEFIRALKQYKLYEGMDAMYLNVGGSSTAHQVNYMDTRSTKYMAFSGSVTHDATGIDFASGAYASVGFTSKGKGNGVSIYLKDDVGIDDAYVETKNGGNIATQGRFSIYPDSAGIFKGVVTGTTMSTGFANGGATGLFTLQRGRNYKHIDSLYFYKNGVLLGKEYNAPNHTMPGTNMSININSQRTGEGGSTTGFQFFAIHDAFNSWQVQKLYQCVHALQTNLSRQAGGGANYPSNYIRTKTYKNKVKATYWRRTSTGGYSGRDGAGVKNTQGDTVIQVGGWDGIAPTFNEIWVSADSGKTWTDYGDGAFPPKHSFGLLKLGSYYYQIGSDLYGTVAQRDDVWRSPDMRNWTLIQDTAGWVNPVILSGFAVHNDSLWKVGGQDTIAGTITLFGDVWKSINGISWTQVCANCAPKIGNYSENLISFGGYMWVIMGGRYHDSSGRSWRLDVYRSNATGTTWKKVSEIPFWEGAQYNNVFVYNNRLYVSLNSSNINSAGWGLLYSSADGLTWRCEGDKLGVNHAKALTVAFGGILETSGTSSNIVYFLKQTN